MVMSNIEWMKLAATGGRGGGMQIASADGGQTSIATTAQSGPTQGPSQARPKFIATRLVFIVDKYVSVLQGDLELRFRVIGGGPGATGGYCGLDDAGQKEFEDVQIPTKGGSVVVYLRQEDEKELYASCPLASNESGCIHVLISPVTEDVPVTQENKRTRAAIGGGLTTKDGGSLQGSGKVLGVGVEGTVSTETSRNSDTTNSTEEQTTSRQNIQKRVVSFKCAPSEEPPSYSASFETSGKGSA